MGTRSVGKKKNVLRETLAKHRGIASLVCTALRLQCNKGEHQRRESKTTNLRVALYSNRLSSVKEVSHQD